MENNNNCHYHYDISNWYEEHDVNIKIKKIGDVYIWEMPYNV